MNSRMRNMRLLLFFLVLILLIGIWGCSKTPQRDIELMNRAEELMETAPDSSLAIMESVDSDALRGRADRARYALLMSMALDKNYIDTTDFSILQPAIDYYPKHGSPDECLKTRYYEGRIHMNRGDDDAAMMAFLKAEEDTVSLQNSVAHARLLLAIATLSHRKFQTEPFINGNKKAAEIYLSRKDTLRTFLCYHRCLEGYTLNNDTLNAKKIGQLCDSLILKYPEYIPEAVSGLTIYHLTFDNPEELSKSLEFYEKISGENKQFSFKIDLANAYFKLKDYSKALQYIESARGDLGMSTLNLNDSIRFNAISIDIYEHNDMFKEAAEASKEYIKNITAEHSYLFNSGVFSTEERYNNEITRIKERTRFHEIIFGLIIGLLLIGFLLLLTLFLIRKAKAKKKELELQYDLELANKIRIEIEYKNSLIEKEKTRLEFENAEKEKELLQQQINSMQRDIDNLISEKDDLKNILDKTEIKDPKIRKIIKKRIVYIDDFLKRMISSNKTYEQNFKEIAQTIHSNKEEFLEHLKNSYIDSNPNMIEICRKANLTDREIKYICMVALGLKNKEIGPYMNLTRINVFASQIRMKLKIPRNMSTLGKYIKDLIDNENRTYDEDFASDNCSN